MGSWEHKWKDLTFVAFEFCTMCIYYIFFLKVIKFKKNMQITEVRKASQRRAGNEIDNRKQGDINFICINFYFNNIWNKQKNRDTFLIFIEIKNNTATI